MAPHLTDDAELLSPPQLCIQETSLVDGNSRIAGQRLEHHQVALIEGIQLVAFDIQHADDPLLRLERHAKLRASLSDFGHKQISWLLAHVRYQ